MAGEILTFQYILVNQQPDAFFPVIHKPHDRHGSGFDVRLLIDKDILESEYFACHPNAYS